MPEVVVLGAGLSGTLMTYELLDQIRPEDHVTLIGQKDRYHFVPSNPWVAVGWRSKARASTDSAAQHQLGVRGDVGAPRQDRL